MRSRLSHYTGQFSPPSKWLPKWIILHSLPLPSKSWLRFVVLLNLVTLTKASTIYFQKPSGYNWLDNQLCKHTVMHQLWLWWINVLVHILFLNWSLNCFMSWSKGQVVTHTSEVRPTLCYAWGQSTVASREKYVSCLLSPTVDDIVSCVP